MKYDKFLDDLDLIDSDHKKFSAETPLREDAFEISDKEKISIIEKNSAMKKFSVELKKKLESLKAYLKLILTI